MINGLLKSPNNEFRVATGHGRTIARKILKPGRRTLDRMAKFFGITGHMYVPEAACWRFQKRDGPGWRIKRSVHFIIPIRTAADETELVPNGIWNYNYNTRPSHPLMMEKQLEPEISIIQMEEAFFKYEIIYPYLFGKFRCGGDRTNYKYKW